MGRWIVVIVVVVSLLLAACGGDDADHAHATAPRRSVPPASGAQRVVPTRDAVDVHPVNFNPRDVRAIENGVAVRFWGGIAPCFVLDRSTVDEKPSLVRIGLFAGRARRNEKIACAEIALRYEVIVPLDAPLGTRTVIDANAR
jgi:hypothetical protein